MRDVLKSESAVAFEKRKKEKKGSLRPCMPNVGGYLDVKRCV